MKEKIIKYLSCPKCYKDLSLQKHTNTDSYGHLMDGELMCSGCKTIYPIVNGVPFFSLHLSNSKIDLNRKNFADEWNYFTATMDKRNETLAKEELESCFYPLATLEDLNDKIVLDAGCGGGRFVYVASKESKAKEIIGLDLSDAVFTAFKNTKHLNNVTIIQGDLTNLPFKKDRIFDFIYSIGVLHHTPSPASGFNSLVKNLKDGGKILTWVYGKEGNFLYITFADPLRQLIISRLPFKVNLALSFIIAGILWSIIWFLYTPFNLICREKLSNKILPFNEYFNFFKKRGFKDFWRTIFDKMVPTISYYISKEEFNTWFTSNNLEHKIHFRNGHSWTGIGTFSTKNLYSENHKIKEFTSERV